MADPNPDDSTLPVPDPPEGTEDTNAGDANSVHVDTDAASGDSKIVPADVKLFVGGLNPSTKEAAFKAYFEKFGEIRDVTLMMHSNTRRSRGYGYITYVDASSVSKVLSVDEHFLDNKKIDPKLPKLKEVINLGTGADLKVFVADLSSETTEEEIRAHFSQYGAITDVDLPSDWYKRQRCPYCFITFQSQEVVDAVLASGKHLLGNKEVEVKKLNTNLPKKNDEEKKKSNGTGVRGRGARGFSRGFPWGSPRGRFRDSFPGGPRGRGFRGGFAGGHQGGFPPRGRGFRGRGGSRGGPPGGFWGQRAKGQRGPRGGRGRGGYGQSGCGGYDGYEQNEYVDYGYGQYEPEYSQTGYGAGCGYGPEYWGW